MTISLFNHNLYLTLLHCHQDHYRVITLSKLFTLMVLRPTQPSIPSG